jgi:hypothetical protein
MVSILIMPCLFHLLSEFNLISFRLGYLIGSLLQATYATPVHTILLIGLMNTVEGNPWMQVIVAVLSASLYLLQVICIGYWLARLDRRQSVSQLALRHEYA